MDPGRDDKLWRKVLGRKHRRFLSGLNSKTWKPSARKRPKGDDGAALPVQPGPKPSPLAGGAEAPIE